MENKNLKQVLQKKAKEESEEQIVKEVKEDLFARQQARKNLEAVWRLNMNFVAGNQYCGIGGNNQIIEYEKQYFWQEREVYNHIAGLVEVRQSKLSSVKPVMTVIPASADAGDMATARVCNQICNGLWHKMRLSNLITRATSWSEVCGTAFYKIVWDSTLGESLIVDNEKVKLGDVCVSVVPPFELYPDSLSREDVDDCDSIIHARAYRLDEIKDMYGVTVEGEKLDLFTLDYSSTFKPAYTGVASGANYALVIERYEKPSKAHPNGRLLIVSGNKLCYDGDLPFINGENGKRAFPFVRQFSIPIAGSFYGASIVERAIPVQRAYNAIKNRKNEFLNRLSMGVVMVEDGAVDVDNLEAEGLYPGKVLVYRQGANIPTFMAPNKLPVDFDAEETRLQNEFSVISGVNDLMRASNLSFTNMSGTALQILLEQDNTRVSVSTDSIENAICEIAKHTLRLYKQFVKLPRLMNLVGEKGCVDALYFNDKDITTDDVVIDTQNEITLSKAQQRAMVFEIINSGLLQGADGKINESTRLKLIEMLGLGINDVGADVDSAQIHYAQKENLQFSNGNFDSEVQEIDDHDLHIKEHTAFLLGSVGEKLKANGGYEKVLQHIRDHKRFKQLQSEVENLQN